MLDDYDDSTPENDHQVDPFVILRIEAGCTCQFIKFLNPCADLTRQREMTGFV